MGRRFLRGLRRVWLGLRSRRIPVVHSSRYQQAPSSTLLDPLRGEKILVALDDAGLLSPHGTSEPRPVSLANLRRIHGAEYLRSLGDSERLGRILGTPVPARDTEAILDLQRLMVGGTIQATRLALRTGGVAFHLGGGFHHAMRDAGMGFCVFVLPGSRPRLLWGPSRCVEAPAPSVLPPLRSGCQRLLGDLDPVLQDDAIGPERDWAVLQVSSLTRARAGEWPS